MDAYSISIDYGNVTITTNQTVPRELGETPRDAMIAALEEALTKIKEML